MRLPDNTKMRVLLAHLRHCRVSMRHQVTPASVSYRDSDRPSRHTTPQQQQLQGIQSVTPLTQAHVQPTSQQQQPLVVMMPPLPGVITSGGNITGNRMPSASQGNTRGGPRKSTRTAVTRQNQPQQQSQPQPMLSDGVSGGYSDGTPVVPMYGTQVMAIPAAQGGYYEWPSGYVYAGNPTPYLTPQYVTPVHTPPPQPQPINVVNTVAITPTVPVQVPMPMQQVSTQDNSDNTPSTQTQPASSQV